MKQRLFLIGLALYVLAAVIAAVTACAQGPVANTQPSIKELIDKRVDAVSTNNYITGANGIVTLYSASMNAIKGVSPILNMNNKVRLFSIVATPTNSAQVQVWTPAGAKIGVETNNYVFIFIK